MAEIVHSSADLTRPLGIGLVGAGAFGEFCLAAFAELPEVRIAAIADLDLERAKRLAARYQCVAYPTIDALLADLSVAPAVSIIALNTPPNLHGSQGLAVLKAGKHLFAEKPLALTLAEGDQLIETARSNQLQLTVDYIMRYNPFWAAAAALARAGVLGALRHMDLANHANGLSLAKTHWFWDQERSGGIWIEHGVHFFDAFSWVSGQPGEALAAAAYQRADGAVDRVEGLFRYGDTAAHCYHAFDQSGQSEQTTVYLTFEHGYLTLREWVPTSLEVRTLIPRAAWEQFLPTLAEYTELPDGQHFARVYAPEGKSALYRSSIQAGMRQLVSAIQGTSPLIVTGQMGLDSLRTALSAVRVAKRLG